MRKITPPQQLPDDADSKPAEFGNHIPVLLSETVSLLAPRAGERYLDLTAGYAGHASKIIDVIGAANATLVDRDARAIAALEPMRQQGARVLHSDFLTAAHQLLAQNEQFNMILVDLGVSSPQLDIAERGFSIKRDGPLDMRMDDRQERTAADIVNRAPKRELIDMLETYGEERPGRAQQIATAIIKARPIRTTHELAEVVLSTHRGPHQKVHPATRTFQAIRIALNDEIVQVTELLPLLPRLLTKGGRVVVISFHSLEDRLVKHYFAENAGSGYEAELQLLTKKPIRGDLYDVHNPRARSAVLRAAVKK